MTNMLLRTTLLCIASAGTILAQAGLTLPPSGNNQKAAVTQYIGPVAVTIEYSSPAVHGPDGKDRRGQIWGKLVPYGLTNLGFGNGKPGPWRAGANENTVFAISSDVLVQGERLPAGRYGLHMIAGPEEWTIVFSKNSTSWGSFFYEPEEDALRVKAKPAKHEYREWLTYEFTERKQEEATVELQWEDLALAWNIKVPNISDVYVTRLSEELRTSPGFAYQAYVAASQYCVQSGKNLEKALVWADAAISMPFIGQENFNTLSNKAQVLAKMGRAEEGKPLMEKALNHPATTSFQIHQYGRQLLAARKSQEAMEVFQLNAKRNGENWPVHVGLARGYAGVGDNKKALEHAQKALAQAPDDLNRDSLKAMIETLSKGDKIAQ